MLDIAFIRDTFASHLEQGNFVTDKTGVRCLEIIGASFYAANEPSIFAQPNEDYIAREIAWYESKSLNVYDIPGGPPAIWKQVADREGYVNSNYGWCIWSEANGSQYRRVLEELRRNQDSRRAVMIYTRPDMWEDYNRNGRSDFMCTNAVQYLIRHGRLEVVVQMRSNDAVFGYRNDYAWQRHVQVQLLTDLGIPPGDIVWNAGSLHVYERHFYLVDHYAKTGETHVSLKRYRELYPNSEWSKVYEPH